MCLQIILMWIQSTCKESDHYANFHIAGNAEKASCGGDISPILQRNYSQRTINNFLNEVNEIEWSGITKMDDAQQAYSAFHKLLAEKYVSCFPFKKIAKRYYHNKPWLTAGLKESIKIKNKLYVTRLQGGNTEEQYRIYRNKLNHVMRTAERNHYLGLLNEHKSNLKKSWQILKMVINKWKCTPVCTKFQTNGKVVSDGHEISNKFNRFFVNVGSTLANAIPPTNKNPSEYMTSNKVLFVVSSVTENEIEKIIENLKESSCGWDELTPSIMKYIKQGIKIPLTHISNLSFQTGVFPAELKIANVVPIFISGDETIFKNYRPVSVLPIFSKILERFMYNRLTEFINENGLLYKYHFGFQKGKSTSMALETLIDKITEALDRHHWCFSWLFQDFWYSWSWYIITKIGIIWSTRYHTQMV